MQRRRRRERKKTLQIFTFISCTMGGNWQIEESDDKRIARHKTATCFGVVCVRPCSCCHFYFVVFHSIHRTRAHTHATKCVLRVIWIYSSAAAAVFTPLLLLQSHQQHRIFLWMMDSIVICSLSFAIYFPLSSVLCPFVPIAFFGAGVCVCMCWWYIVPAFDSSLSLSYRTSDINTHTHTHGAFVAAICTHTWHHISFHVLLFFRSLSTRNEELIVIYVYSFFPFQLICLLYLLFALSCGGSLLLSLLLLPLSLVDFFALNISIYSLLKWFGSS